MGLTILLVDDDQILIEKTKNSLNWDNLGIGMVFTANNIHEAKGILKVYKVDILLCDVICRWEAVLSLWNGYVRKEKI